MDNHLADHTLMGIDYGSKLSGNTVIALLDKEQISFHRPPQKKDADIIIMQLAKEFRPGYVFIDAPLSLPGIYSKSDGYSDYFYRRADREIGAMSPMFLGGLTARAMRLAKELQKHSSKIIESYPAAIARSLELHDRGYKKDKKNIEKLAPLLKEYLGIDFDENAVTTWHHIDALLTLVIAKRYFESRHLVFGEKEEGLIYV